VTNPKGASKGDCRIIRGGCFTSIPMLARVFMRECRDPDWISNWIGFRLARSAEQ